MIYNETLNVSLSNYKCNSFTLYIFLVTSIVISAVFIYFKWYSKKILQSFITSITSINETSETS